MKIAVLMSTYNGHRFLNKQLESLANQTVADNMTVYIRDDGSSDNTFDIIDNWKEKLEIVLYKEKNAGPAMSFWMLLMNPEIQADYYAFCDQDDIWDASKIEKGMMYLKENVHLYACNCRIIDENDRVTQEQRIEAPPNMDIRNLFVSGCTQGCSMVFSDTLCQFIRNSNISCVPMHDIVLMLYAKFVGEIYWDQEPHFGYRVHSNNVVAKCNKSIFKRIETTIWNWKNSSENSMAMVAFEMLSNIKNLNCEEKMYLECISNYKNSVRCKIRIISNKNTNGVSKKLLRSYRMRVVLNLF